MVHSALDNVFAREHDPDGAEKYFCVNAFIDCEGADISVLSQVVILSVYEKKNGTDEI